MFCEISGGQFSGGKVVSFQAEETLGNEKEVMSFPSGG